MPNAKPTIDTPIIFVHGMIGAWLKDRYPVDNQVRFPSPLPSDIDALALLPQAQMVDAGVGNWLRNDQAIAASYEGIVDELRDECTPYTYAFTYDWRKDNRHTAELLAAFIDEALYRAGEHEKLAGRAPPTKVVLVGHSMGGLVIKYAVKAVTGVADKVDRVFTIGTPYGGSLKASEMLIAGARRFFGADLLRGLRHAARTMPGVFQLSPTYPGSLVSGGSDLDVFDTGTWQQNLRKTLKKAPFFDDYLDEMLDGAQAFTNVVASPYSDAQQQRFFMCVGVGTPSWEQVPVGPSPKRTYAFKDVVEGSGDGTVAEVSASFSPAPADHVLYDEPNWLDPREWVLGHHSNMCNHDLVKDWVVNTLTDSAYADLAFISPQ